MKHHLRLLLAVTVVCLVMTGCAVPGGTLTAASTGTTPPAITAPSATPDSAPDGKFTIVIFPDTQQEVIGEAARYRLFAQRCEWLVSKKEELNLSFVLHTGDVVNWGDADESQLVVASDAMAILDNADIPVVYALGNHDTAAVGVGGSAAVPSETITRVRDTTAFNKYFSTTRYPYLNVKDEGIVDNAYALLEAGGVKWMILTLEIWPRTEVVAWANQVVRSHGDHNVIIITHSYLTDIGDIQTSNGGYGANSPKYLYDNLISRHDNIKMVFCGHTGYSAVRTDIGRGGNKIVSVLGSYHSNNYNPVRLLQIDVKGGILKSQVYTPINGGQWSQYSFTVKDMTFIGA